MINIVALVGWCLVALTFVVFVWWLALGRRKQ